MLETTTTTLPIINQQGTDLLLQGLKELLGACVTIGNGLSSLTEPIVKQFLAYLSPGITFLSGLVNLLVDVILLYLVFMIAIKIQKTTFKLAIIVIIGLIAFALFSSNAVWVLSLFK